MVKDLLQPILSDDDRDRRQRAERLGHAHRALTAMQDGQVDAKEIDRELIAARLRKAAVMERGERAFEQVSAAVEGRDVKLWTWVRSDHRRHGLTALVSGAISDKHLLFTGDKAGVFIKWTVSRDVVRKQHVFKVDSPVLDMALSSDCKYLAVACRSGSILVYDGLSNRFLGVLSQHRGPCLAVDFPDASYTLYSGGHDRTVMVWSVDQMAHLDTVYGHQDQVYSLASLPNDRCVSVGGRDRTVRIWKLAEESQLILRLSDSDGGMMECVTVVGQIVATGSDDGTLSFWSCTRKKPICSVKSAHQGPLSMVYSPEKTDLLVTGGHDGLIRLWKVEGCNEAKSIPKPHCIMQAPCPGHIISASFSHSMLFVAVSPEERLGRWSAYGDIKPTILVFTFS